MSEPKTPEYQVITTDDDTVVYSSDNRDKAVGVAEYLADVEGQTVKVSQVILA